MGKRRKHSKIDQLEPAVKETVDEMIKTGAYYREIVDYIQSHGGQHFAGSSRKICKEFDEHTGCSAAESGKFPGDHGRN